MRMAQDAQVIPSKASMARLSADDSNGGWRSSTLSAGGCVISEAMLIAFIFIYVYSHTPPVGVCIVYSTGEHNVKGWIERKGGIGTYDVFARISSIADRGNKKVARRVIAVSNCSSVPESRHET